MIRRRGPSAGVASHVVGLAALALALSLLTLALPRFAAGEPARPPRTGWDFAAFPLFNFTTDRGVGYGGYLATFYYGPEGSGDRPYKASVGGQFYQTTRGYAYHKLLMDVPDIANTGVRLDVASGYETWDSAWYFGLGNRTPRLEPDDTPRRFYEMDLDSLWLVPNVRAPLTEDVSVFVGAVLRSADLRVYPGSLLDSDAPRGRHGGFLGQLQAGVLFDTRDREPSSTRGAFGEISVRGSHGALGSDFDVWGANATHRHWFPLVSGGVLTLALRAGLDVQGGAVPFFHQHILGGSQWVELGGSLAFRGLPNGRHRGNVTAYTNTELRWLASSLRLDSVQFDLIVAPFFDVGRVWLWGERDDALHLHASGGTGLRVAYNEVFVMRFDFAVAMEEYVEATDPEGGVERRPVLGVYAMVNHPF